MPRGGIAIKHYFPLDGEYTLRFFLQRSDLAASYSPRGLDVAKLPEGELLQTRGW